MSRSRIAMVVQRYGADLAGGAERLCAAVAAHLAARHDVVVLTTTAKESRSWANHYPPGRQVVDGVTIHRFPVAGERSPDFDQRYPTSWYEADHDRQAELRWLRDQGPHCPALLDYLAAHRDDYDAFLFYTYLYEPTVLGLPLVEARSILIPTAHDEPPMRLGIYDDLFRRPRSLIFLTPAERRFIQRRFGNTAIPSTIAAMGLPTAPAGDAARFRRRHGIAGDILLYAGRIEGGKGCGDLVDWFCRFLPGWRRDVHLVLLGQPAMTIPAHPKIHALGFVDEAEKADAFAASTVVVAPSPHESLSILALEAWQAGKPVLANGRSDVLVDHCHLSNGGLYYTNPLEFDACVRLLLTDDQLRRRLGENGRRYVAANYTWPTVIARYERVIAGVRREATRRV